MNYAFIAVQRQVEAMSVDLFEVGLFKPAVPGETTREPEMLPRTWDRATLLNSVGWLRYQNSRGRNIYIRPKGEHALSMVDDLTAASIDRMKREGFAPCLVVETSPGNFQAWLNHGEILPKTESTLAARALAERFGGDKGAADWRHFGRLAGFTNRKPKYCGPDGLFPFVKLSEASSTLVYSQARGFLQRIHLQHRNSVARPLSAGSSRRVGKLLTIDDFRARSEYGSDNNRIDLAFAIYALSHGIPEDDVKAAISSRDLTKKGTEARQQQYIERTIGKAALHCQSGRAR